ncbi:20541_t:CDS:2, partial [Gigaspora rosea]
IALLQLILCGISPIYNRIIIELSHNDDKENEAFLNGTLPFEQFIKIIYSSDDDSDDSLSLRSTSDSPSSRLHTKRHIDLYFQGGEARCLPSNTQNISHATWDSPIHHSSSNTIWFIWGFKDLSDKKFTMGRGTTIIIYWCFYIPGVTPPVGHQICISGYVSHVKCGGITSTDVRVQIRSIRAGQRLDSMEFNNDEPYILVHGIVTNVKFYGNRNISTVAIQPIYRIIESYSLFAHFQFVDLDIYGQLEQ